MAEIEPTTLKIEEAMADAFQADHQGINALAHMIAEKEATIRELRAQLEARTAQHRRYVAALLAAHNLSPEDYAETELLRKKDQSCLRLIPVPKSDHHD